MWPNKPRASINLIVSIMQPAYLPWLGYFDRVAKSDVSIVLDGVMIERGSFTNRNKIRGRAGWNWLTVPVNTSGQPLISEVTIDQSKNWRAKHLQSILHNYAHSHYFKEHKSWLEGFYATPWEMLNPMLSTLTDYLLDVLKIDTPLLYSSQMNVEGKKSELVLNLCREVGATQYLSGPLGRGYLDMGSFEDAGIEVIFHEYVHPQYMQTYEGFEPYMCVLDLIVNCGSTSRHVLEQGSLGL